MNLNSIHAWNFISIVAMQNKNVLSINNLPFQNGYGQRFHCVNNYLQKV